MELLISATALFLGVVALFASVLDRLDRAFNARIPGAATASGVVVGFETQDPPGPWIAGDSSSAVRLQMAEVRVKTPSGQELTFTSKVETSLRPEIGREVEVLYDPEDPSRAQIAPESQPRSASVIRTAMWVFLEMFGSEAIR